jgi:F0F1-type ATP synthase assembly protein I
MDGLGWMDDGGNEPSAGSGLRGRDLLGLGGLLVAAVVGGLVIGLLLDQAVGTSPLFVLLGLLLGVVAGAAGFWVRVRSALRD